MPVNSSIIKYKHVPGRALTAKEKRDLAKLALLPDDQIDTSDIPELSSEEWKNAVRGKFFRSQRSSADDKPQKHS